MYKPRLRNPLERESWKIACLLLILILPLGISCGSSPQVLKIDLRCDENCNDNNAVVVKIYQLKNDEKFRHSSFESLARNIETTLGDDLIPNSKYEKTLVPNETYEFKEIEIEKNATFLGIFGDFFSPEKDSWIQVVPVNSDLEELNITIHKNSISFKSNE